MNPIARIPRAAATVLTLLLIALGAAGASLAASPDQAPPLDPGHARVWFVHQMLPGTAFHPPIIYVNGAAIGNSPQATAFYRDFAPGTYTFGAENCLPEPPQTKQTMTLRPYTQYAIEVTADENGMWDCYPSQITYLRQVQPDRVAYLFAQVNIIGAK